MFNKQLIIVSLVIVITIGTVSFGDDWPQYRGVNGDGISAEEVLQSPVQLWTKNVGTGYPATVICDGRVYTSGHVQITASRGDDTLYCLDAADGSELWTYTYNCASIKGSFAGSPIDVERAGMRATPATDGTYVFFLSLDGHLHCLDALTGELLWYRSVEGHLGGQYKIYGFCSSPMLSGAYVVLDIGGSLCVLNKADGSIYWEVPIGGGWTSAVTPTIVTPNLTVYGSDRIAGVDIPSQTVLWEHDMGRECMTSHIVFGDKVLFSTYPDSGRIAVLDVTGGTVTQDWSMPDVKTYHLTNVLVGGYVYAMDNSGTEWQGNDAGVDDVDTADSDFKCLDFSTGVVEWTEPDIGWASIIASSDELLVLRETGDLVRVTPTDAAYTEIESLSVIGTYCWTELSMADGRVYCRNDKGDIVCLSVAQAVTITASDAMAHEAGTDTAVFTVSRVTDDNSAALTVDFAVSGTGVDGTDYNTIGTQVVIPASQDSVDITITPITVADADDDTVIITLADSPGVYTVGAADSAQVEILDTAAAQPAIIVQAGAGDDYVLENSTDRSVFTVSRSTADAYPLTVSVTMSGTALAADYTMWGSDGAEVVIPAGQTDAQVIIRADDDAAADGNLTLIMTIDANTDYYTIGGSPSVTITLVDDDDAESTLDGDTMDDDWELCFWGNTSETGLGDFDADGLIDEEEYTTGTNPTEADTDRDGSTDGDEVDGGTLPLHPHSFTGGIVPPEPEVREAWCAVRPGAGDGFGLTLIAMLAALSWAALRILYRQTR